MNIPLNLNTKVKVKFTEQGLKLMRSNLRSYSNPGIEKILKKFETNQKADKYNIIALIDLVYLLKQENKKRNYILVENNEVILSFGFWTLVKNLFRRKKC